MERTAANKNPALFRESLFHNERITEDEGLQHEELYVNFGGDAQKNVEQKLESGVNEVVRNGLSQARMNILKKPMRKYNQIFKLRPATGGPA